MSNKIRKRIWPVSLATAIGVVAMLTVLAATVWGPSPAQAQQPVNPPSNLTATAVSDTQIDLSWSGSLGASSYELQRKSGTDAFATIASPTTTSYMDTGLTASTMYTYQVRGVNSIGNTAWSPEDMATTMAAAPPPADPPAAMLDSSSSTGSAAVKLILTIDLDENLTGSSWVEIYLEDDYQEPGSIAKDDVVFEVQGTNPAETDPPSNPTLNTTFAAADVEIDDGGDLNGEDNAVVISARIPDMRSGDETGYPLAGQTLLMVVSTDADIKNPSEAGSHDTGFSIIGGTVSRAGAAGTEDIGAGDNANADGKLLTKAKISLSADDGGRGTEVTITGTGFNNGTTAEAFVLVADTKPMDCMTLIANSDSESLGTVAVGSDDKFSIAFTVHQDEFDAGMVNWICAKDSESEGGNRYSSDVDPFEVKDSLSITPDAVASGEEVTLKPRDFMSSATLEYVYLGGTGVDDTLMCCATGNTPDPVQRDGSSDYVFDMPGGYSGSLRITVKYSDGAQASDTITVNPSSLTLSKAEVAPNETIIISGSGFSEGKTINVKDIELDGKSMVVDNAGTQACGVEDLCVKTTSSGEFTATVSAWAMGENNPALDDDEYTIKVTDSEGFVGKAKITILEPTVSVIPEMVSPRDFITISGENWPISTADDDHEVKIMVDDRNRSVNIDGNGRFRYEYQLRSNIGIGDEHEVVVVFEGDGGKIEEEATFEVHDAGIMLTPTEAAPGQTISVEIEGMPPYTLVNHVNIDGVNRLGGQNLNTDRHGNVMITGVLVPYLDPGFYPVEVMVGEETRVVQLEVLAEAVVAGVAAALPGAVEDLGENLVRIFHFNTSSKVWTFYDPRPEFEGLNTLTELAAGQPYWILVPETQENVVLNGRPRNLTCVGGDCWNQLVW